MSAYQLETSPLTAAWRTVDPGIPAGALLSADTIADGWARRMVARAKRRYDLTMNPGAAAIADEDAYITNACQSGSLKGFCFVAADEIATYLSERGARAKCVRVGPKGGGGDHYFTVVNRGKAKTSLIVDATWLQFAMGAHPFCLAGTLDQVKASIRGAHPSIKLLDAYRAGLQVVDRWAAYSCFQ